MLHANICFKILPESLSEKNANVIQTLHILVLLSLKAYYLNQKDHASESVILPISQRWPV